MTNSLLAMVSKNNNNINKNSVIFNERQRSRQVLAMINQNLQHTRVPRQPTTSRVTDTIRQREATRRPTGWSNGRAALVGGGRGKVEVREETDRHTDRLTY